MASDRLVDSPEDSTRMDSMRDWVEVNPVATIGLAAAGGAATSWLGSRGIELATDIDFSSLHEVSNAIFGAGAGALACSVTLHKIFGS